MSETGGGESGDQQQADKSSSGAGEAQEDEGEPDEGDSEPEDSSSGGGATGGREVGGATARPTTTDTARPTTTDTARPTTTDTARPTTTDTARPTTTDTARPTTTDTARPTTTDTARPTTTDTARPTTTDTARPTTTDTARPTTTDTARPTTTDTARPTTTDREGGEDDDDGEPDDGHDFIERVGPLRPSARPLERNEGELLTPEQGLQSSTSEPFKSVNEGEYGDPKSKYLWTIDQRGINIAQESTPFDTPRGNIVHTNISSQASIGGEAWFGPDNSVTINAGSGRFGDGAGVTPDQWGAAVDYWESLGYTVNAIQYGSR